MDSTFVAIPQLDLSKCEIENSCIITNSADSSTNSSTNKIKNVSGSGLVQFVGEELDRCGSFELKSSARELRKKLILDSIQKRRTIVVHNRATSFKPIIETKTQNNKIENSGTELSNAEVVTQMKLPPQKPFSQKQPLIQKLCNGLKSKIKLLNFSSNAQ